MLKWARVVAEAASVVDIAVNTSVSPHGVDAMALIRPTLFGRAR